LSKYAGPVDLHTEGISFPTRLVDRELASHRLRELIRSYRKDTGAINIILCSDEALQAIHKDYLDKDDLTDIVTFDYVEGDRIAGDLFISIERVRENASELDRSPEEELHRVMAHGVLHLLGFKDKSEEDHRRMRKAEDEALRAWGFQP
jgi:rRNA maturation RNase YbeY